jgi:hypothetical protein
MAQFVPVKSSIALRLNLGADPESDKAVLRAVSIGRVSPDLTAERLDAVSAKVIALFVHPVVSVEKAGTDLLDPRRARTGKRKNR